MTQVMDSAIYRIFAYLLRYPQPGMEKLVVQLLDRLPPCTSPAVERLGCFKRFVEHASLAEMEEIYTRTFDLQGLCYPYIGQYLFGQTYQRSQFMARLNHEYFSRGILAGNELPDHAAVILEFLASGDGDEFSQVLVSEGLIPALRSMVEALRQNDKNPYGLLIEALWLVLGEEINSEQAATTPAGGLEHA